MGLPRQPAAAAEEQQEGDSGSEQHAHARLGGTRRSGNDQPTISATGRPCASIVRASQTTTPLAKEIEAPDQATEPREGIDIVVPRHCEHRDSGLPASGPSWRRSIPKSTTASGMLEGRVPRWTSPIARILACSRDGLGVESFDSGIAHLPRRHFRAVHVDRSLRLKPEPDRSGPGNWRDRGASSRSGILYTAHCELCRFRLTCEILRVPETDRAGCCRRTSHRRRREVGPGNGRDIAEASGVALRSAVGTRGATRIHRLLLAYAGNIEG